MFVTEEMKLQQEVFDQVITGLLQIKLIGIEPELEIFEDFDILVKFEDLVVSLFETPFESSFEELG